MTITVTRLRERYQVGSDLAKGEGGAVYRAVDRVLGDKPVVVKTLTSDGAVDKRVTEQGRLHDALHQIAQLSHPNIAPLTDWFTEFTRAYVVMGFIEGETLASVMASREISMQEAVAWVAQLAGALEALHGLKPPVTCGVLDPSHVVVDAAGQAHLVNLGLSRLVDAAPSVNPPRRHLTDYAAPELEGGKEGDERADIYSLGAVMYHLFTGNRPPKGISIALGKAMLPRPSEAHPAIPKALEAIILRAMTVDQNGRYRGMRDLRTELERMPKAELKGMTGGKAASGSGLRAAVSNQPNLRAPALPKPVFMRPRTAFIDAVIQEELDEQQAQRRKGAGKRIAVVAVGSALLASLVGGAWYAGKYFRPAPGAAAAASDSAAQASSADATLPAPQGGGKHRATKEQLSYNCIIDSTPRGAQVWVDGQLANGLDSSDTPMKIWLDLGKHEIVVRKQGYADYSLTKRVVKGQTGDVNAKLTRVAAQAPSSPSVSGKSPAPVASPGVPSGVGAKSSQDSPPEKENVADSPPTPPPAPKPPPPPATSPDPSPTIGEYIPPPPSPKRDTTADPTYVPTQPSPMARPGDYSRPAGYGF